MKSLKRKSASYNIEEERLLSKTRIDKMLSIYYTNRIAC